MPPHPPTYLTIHNAPISTLKQVILLLKAWGYQLSNAGTYILGRNPLPGKRYTEWKYIRISPSTKETSFGNRWNNETPPDPTPLQEFLDTYLPNSSLEGEPLPCTPLQKS
jgi:hypothetical protein